MLNNKSIRFSFIMPAYNVEKYIEKAIESVLAQTYDNWELIIVNDGSTDKTLEIVEKYIKNYSKIKIITQPNSGTGYGSRLGGIPYITGEYTQLLDADDYVAPDMLEKYVNRLSEDDLDILVPNVQCLTDEGKIWLEFYPPEKDYSKILNGEEAFYLSLPWKIHGWNCAKTSIFKKVYCYSSSLINEDEFACRKIYYTANKIGFADGFYYYRYLPQSISHKFSPIRKYHYMETYYNIYNYSLQNKMTQYVIDEAHSVYFEHFLSCALHFEDDLETIKSEETKAAYIKNVMQELYQKNSTSDVRKFYKHGFIKKMCYSCLYAVSKNVFEFAKNIKKLRKIKRILKRG